MLVGAVVALVVVVAAVVAAVVLTGGGGGESAAVGDDWSRVAHDEAELGGSTDVVAQALAAGESGLVAVGADGALLEENAAVWTSPDGKSWERVADADGVFGGPPRESSGPGDTFPSLQFIRGVVAGGPGFVAVGEDQSQDVQAAVWTSPDGQSWSRVSG